MASDVESSGLAPKPRGARPDRAAPGATLLGRYQLTALLGESALGWVLAGRDTQAIGASNVAVTVLRPEHAGPGSLVRSLVQREIAIALRVLGEAPGAGIARPVESAVCDDEELTFFVTELIDGPSLDELAGSQGPLLPEEARVLGCSIARTLAALHGCGYALGDLSARAIRLRKGVEPVLVDLGLAKRAADRSERDARAPAPEERDRSVTTAAADVYRLGLVLCELASRKPAGKTAPYRTAEGAPDSHAASFAFEPGNDFDACVRWCLEPDPRHRPTATDVAAALTPRSERRRRRRAIAAGAAAASIAAFIVGMGFTHRLPPRLSATSAPLRIGSAAPPPPAPFQPTPVKASVRVVPTEGAAPQDLAPMKIHLGQPITALAARGSLVIEQANGQLLSFSPAWSGALAVGRAPFAVEGVEQPRSVSGGFVVELASTFQGQLWGWSDEDRPHAIPGIAGIRSVAVGDSIAALLRDDGRVLTWLLHPPRVHENRAPVPWTKLHRMESVPPTLVEFIDEVTAIAADGDQVLALRGGRVWVWGEHAAFGRGSTRLGAPVMIDGLSNITAIAAGVEHGLALDKDGVVWAWGDSSHGQRGRRFASTDLEVVSKVRGLPPIRAIAAGRYSGLALDTKGGVWEWGSRYTGYNTRSDNAPSPGEPPHLVAGLPPAKLIATCGNYSAAVSDTNAVWAWGRLDTTAPY
jgi:hypothetical protein